MTTAKPKKDITVYLIGPYSPDSTWRYGIKIVTDEAAARTIQRRKWGWIIQEKNGKARP